MKKKRNVNFLKIGVLLFSISLLLWNCEKPEIFQMNELSVPSIENSKSAFLVNNKQPKSTGFISKIKWDKSSSIRWKEEIDVLHSPIKLITNKAKSFVASVEK
jgi:hypothetical protein